MLPPQLGTALPQPVDESPGLGRGRIGEAQALLGTMLGIKPFLTLEGGAIQPMEKVRTREEALEKLVEFVSEFDGLEKLAIIRGMNDRPDEIAMLHERFEGLFPELEVPVIHYGPVLSSHIGPDNLGVMRFLAIIDQINCNQPGLDLIRGLK